MERVKITTAEDVFLVERGVVVAGIWLDESQAVAPGSCIEVLRPDGSILELTLSGIEFFTKCFGEKRNVGLLLGELSDKNQVPLGSEVWLVQSPNNSFQG